MHTENNPVVIMNEDNIIQLEELELKVDSYDNCCRINLLNH